MFSRIYNTKSEKMDYIELLDKYMQGGYFSRRGEAAIAVDTK